VFLERLTDMSTQKPEPASIREVLLSEIALQEPKTAISAPLSQRSVLDAAARKLRGCDPQAILTQWSELFRTGLLAWGLDLSNPDPPFFHTTGSGRRALENATRDPSNPAGYLRHLASIAPIDVVSMSYLAEGLECYVAGLYKAAAVMVGAAAEAVILNLREVTVRRLTELGKPLPKDIDDWRIRTVSIALHGLFETHKNLFRRDLREPFEAYWSAFAQQIRAVRNDVGHPKSVDPVTSDTVHASLLIFPELARIAHGLADWVNRELA
jgi:hypothetical protein